MQTAEVRSPHRNTISYYTIHLIYQGPHATPNRNEQSRTAGAAASSRASIARQPAPQCQHAQQHVVSWCSTHTARPCRARPAGASVGALTGRVRICCHCHSVTDRSSGPAAPPVRHATRHTHRLTHTFGGGSVAGSRPWDPWDADGSLAVLLAGGAVAREEDATNRVSTADPR